MQRGASWKQRRILAMVLTLAMLLVQVVNGPLAQATVLSPGLQVSLDQVSLIPGATTTLKLYAQQQVSTNPVEIAGYQVSIGFDPEAVQVKTVSKPTGSAGSDSIQQFVSYVDPGTHTINIVAAGTSGFSGDMVLAEITASPGASVAQLILAPGLANAQATCR